jgi:hypothetical protein
VFVWAKVNERVYGGYPLRQATIRVSRDPELGTIDITINDPSFGSDPKLHGGGLTMRRDDAIWLANALLLALGPRKHFTYSRHSKDHGTPSTREAHRSGGSGGGK